jgi:HK97 family phage portal protein
MGWFSDRRAVAKASFADRADYGGDSFISGIAGRSSISRQKLLAQYTELAYSCINVLAEEIGKYEPYFYKLVDGQEIIDPRHPMLALLEQPNPNMTQYELFEATQSFIEITGECFWYITFGRMRNEPMRIDIVRPDKVEVSIQDEPDPSGRYEVGDVIGYVVTGAKGQQIPLEPRDMIHVKTFNPFNPYRGYSTLEAGFTSIGIDTSTSEFQKRFMDNNATPQSIVSFKGNIGKDAFEKVKKVFSERHAGVRNAGKTLFIRDADVDVKQLGLSLADLDLKDLKTITSERVRGMFRVPMPLLGNTDGIGLGRAGVESEEYIFQKYPIEAKKQRLDDQLKIACRLFWPDDKDVLVGHKTNIPEDGQLVLKEHTDLTGKVITINEARKQRNLLPVEGGDELYVSFNVVRVGKDDENPNDDKDERPPKEEPVEGQDPNNEDLPEQFKMVKITKRLVTKKSPEENLFDNANAIEDQGAIEYEKKLVKLLDEQKSRIIDQYDLFTGKAIETQILPNEETEAERFAASLLLLLFLYLERGGELGVGFVGGSNTEFILDRVTRDAITGSNETVLRSFTRETLQDIQNAVKRALDEAATGGLSAEQTRKEVLKNIEGVYGENMSARAKRLAESEIHKAVNTGLVVGFMRSGVQYIQWKANPGACQFCRRLDGTVKAIGQSFIPLGASVEGDEGGTFVNDYEEIRYAHLHPNCRCLAIPYYPKGSSKELIKVEVPVQVESEETEKLRQALLEQTDYVKALEEIAGVVDDGQEPES